MKNHWFSIKILVVVLVIIILTSSSTLLIPVDADTDAEYDYGIDISDYMDSELDLSQYTFDDLMTMTPQEYGTLVRDFERVYDPYDSYVEPVNENESTTLGGMMVTPAWTSGDFDKDGNYTKEGSHEMITMAACTILSTNKGFFTNNAVVALVIALNISVASFLPDRDETTNINEGHFYDPTTGKKFYRKHN